MGVKRQLSDGELQVLAGGHGKDYKGEYQGDMDGLPTHLVFSYVDFLCLRFPPSELSREVEKDSLKALEAHPLKILIKLDSKDYGKKK